METGQGMPTDAVASLRRIRHSWMPSKDSGGVPAFQVMPPVGMERMIESFRSSTPPRIELPAEERERVIVQARENQERLATLVKNGGYLTDAGTMLSKDVVAPLLHRQRSTRPVEEVVGEQGYVRFSTAENVSVGGIPLDAQEGGVWLLPEHFDSLLGIRWFTRSGEGEGGLEIRPRKGAPADLRHEFVYALGKSVVKDFAAAGVRQWISGANIARQTLNTIALANMQRRSVQTIE